MAERYYSQDGQDEFLDQFVFKGRKSGFFVEIGAHDGIQFSNSVFLERERGWRGICVEPHPKIFPELVRNRRSTNFQCCIHSEPGVVDFSAITGYGQMLSGITNSYTPEHLQRIESELREHGSSLDKVRVETKRLDALLREHGVDDVDYLSIDRHGHGACNPEQKHQGITLCRSQ